MTTSHTLLLSAALLVFTTAGAQILPPDQVDHLIITTAGLSAEFERLADFRAGEGMQARVVTVDWIEATVPAGVDQAETIRRFVQAAHEEWGVRFLLLGGDADAVATRLVHSTFYPFGGYTEIPCDLYYGGLDGDWNADGDEFWGEPFISDGDPGDAADLAAEVLVGRAPVSTLAEATRFVDATLVMDGSDGLIESILIMTEVFFPSTWQPGDPVTLDGGAYGDALYQALMAGDDPPAITRMYENDLYPRDQILNRENALAALNAGTFGLVHDICISFTDYISVGDSVLTLEDLAALTNAPDYFVSAGFTNNGCLFTEDCVGSTLLTAPEGGAVAYVGQSNVCFPSNTNHYMMELFSELVLHGPQRLGTAATTARESRIDNTARNTVDRWTALGLTILGDPALRMGPVPDWDEIVTAANLPGAAPRLTAHPNPFNPRTTVWFELASSQQVTIQAFDLRGRRIRELARGRYPAGRHQVDWDGRGQDGLELPSGVYLLRLAGTAGVASTRISLVR